MTQPAVAHIAPISRRAIGYVIDALIASGLAIVLGGGLLVAATLAGGLEGMLATLTIGGPLVSLVLLGWFVVYTIMQTGKGSIGMRAQGLRLVSAADEVPLSIGRALLRNIIFGLAGSIVVGYFTPLFDGSGRFQGWHDKVAGSLMLDARTAGPAASAASAAPAPSPAVTPGYPAASARAAAPAIPGIPHPSAPSGTAAPAPAFPAPAFPPSVAPAMPSSWPATANVPPAAPQARPAAPAATPTPTPQAAPAAPAADADSLIAFVPGITQDAPPPRATAPASSGTPVDATLRQTPEAPAPAAPAPAASAPEAPAPAAPASAVASAPAPAAAEPVLQESDDIEDTKISIPGHRLVFTWDDGTRVSVSRRTIFGRNPAAEEGAIIVPVRDETLSLSKTHFEAAAEPSGGWVLDRHSTNGMTLVRDGQRIACPAGQRVPVRLGDAIEIGDRIVTVGGYA